MAGSGSLGRRPRMAAADVREQALRTALEWVLDEGLVVSMDHISLEAVIARAEVPRSAVHRLWPRKEQFFGDLLIRLATHRASQPTMFDSGALRKAIDTGLEYRDGIHDARVRFIAVVEVCRQASIENFEDNLRRSDWKTYLALSATALSFPDDIGIQLRAAIDDSERRYAAGMAAFYALMSELGGRRIREAFSGERAGRQAFEMLASVTSAAMEGMVLRSASTADNQPSLIRQTEMVDPFDTGALRPWNGPAILFTSTFLSMTEPVEDYALDPIAIGERLDALAEWISAAE